MRAWFRRLFKGEDQYEVRFYTNGIPSAIVGYPHWQVVEIMTLADSLRRQSVDA